MWGQAQEQAEFWARIEKLCTRKKYRDSLGPTLSFPNDDAAKLLPPTFDLESAEHVNEMWCFMGNGRQGRLQMRDASGHCVASVRRSTGSTFLWRVWW